MCVCVCVGVCVCVCLVRGVVLCCCVAVLFWWRLSGGVCVVVVWWWSLSGGVCVVLLFCVCGVFFVVVFFFIAVRRNYAESVDNTGVKRTVSGTKVLLTLLISTITSNISFIQLSSFNCLQCFRDLRRLVHYS